MDRSFTEMGAAYGTNVVGEQPHMYWTQVFGQPR